MAGEGQAKSPRLSLANLHGETRLAHDLLRDGYFALAVQEASQRFINRVQEIAERYDMDGVSLINHAFSEDAPHLAFSARQTLREKDEHRGFRQLAAGLVTAVRNVLAHQAGAEMDPIEAFEWLAFISTMHRRLDRADRVAQARNDGSVNAP